MLDMAKEAYDADEIPVAAIIVRNNEIVGYGINTRNADKNVLGHAEINAIVMASKNIGDWRLDDCDMYVTLIPCMMCSGAIIESRIRKVYYLCDKTNDYVNVVRYTLCEKINDDLACGEYLKLLQLFFENKRNKE